MGRRRHLVDRMTWVAPMSLRVGVFGFLWWTLAEGDLQHPTLAVIAILASAASSLWLLPPGQVRLRPLAMLRFIPYFLWHSLVGGVDVSRRLLDPRLPVDPGFLRVPLHLRHDAPRSLFAWLVSLLPGTASVAVESEHLVVQVLDRKRPNQATLDVLQRHVASLFAIRPTSPSQRGGRNADLR